MSVLKFTLTGGPYGDATSSYSVSHPDNFTLRDLLEECRERKEWGNIGTQFFKSDSDFYVSYNFHGSDNYDEVPKEFLDRIIKIEHAHGGWSAMDYIISFVPEQFPETPSLF